MSDEKLNPGRITDLPDLAEGTSLRDQLRLALYAGLQEGERAIELTERALAVFERHLEREQVAFIRDPEHPERLPTAHPL